ncbi:hypothetical protein ONE63_007538 [Megalurothrips usitatus]|uniref:SAM domain-containing protein n=1 Tax=Megalurothrips usitatus TaxID=439358 RepID=A0AAV7XVP7_9NEOP|nr:hypothetical protein ONE63_007538 [Megalurothrips usitatus]
MALMRRLLVDAQSKFRRMVEENRQLGERIDGNVQHAHEDVAALRAELSGASQRLGGIVSMATMAATATATTAKALGPPATVVPPPPPTGTSPATPATASTISTSSSSSSPSFSSSVANSSTSRSSDSPASKSNASPDAPETPRRLPPKVIPRRPHSGGDVPDSRTSRSRTDAASESDASSPEKDGVGGAGASPGPSPGGPRSAPPTTTVFSERIGGGGGGGGEPGSTRLRLENERLKREVSELRKLVSASGLSPSPAGSSASSAAATSPGPGGSGAGAGGDAASGGEGPGFSVIADCDGNLRRVRSLESELLQTKEALSALKADRKRLKAEKFDLLNQMKQLYGTLEDKEKELRDFIRNYEQRMRESEASLQQLSTEREQRERERWSLLRHARDEAERSLTLAAQLQHKEQQLQQLQDQLSEGFADVHVPPQQARRSGCLSDQESVASLSVSRLNGLSSGTLVSRDRDRDRDRDSVRDRDRDSRVLGDRERDRGSCSADSGVRGSSDRESGATGNLSDSTTDGERKRTGTPTITVEAGMDMDSISVVSSVTAPHMYQHNASTPKDCSPSLSPLNAHSFSRSIDNSVLSRSVEQLSSPLDMEPRRSKRGMGLGRGGTWGSISRVFARSRHRKVVSPTSQDGKERDKDKSAAVLSESCGESVRSWSPLTEEGYAEKLRLLREAAAVPMERWRASTVLAWLEIALGMPQYGPRCAENVKSGKVLLELSDLELECGLGITHPMHRKKLRLAIEEHRHPALVRYPCIAQLTHTWVSSEWLPDLGLAQYSENFAANMVDARMLDHLSKKELEKFVGVTRKFHQASIVHGIHLLRMVKYDRQALAVRRHQSDHVDADPLVWTNQRFMRWARSIDLAEYADNLKDSGVHGALVVLEPSFNGDTMATALGIPPSKNIIRRHLAAELEALVLPARAAFEHYVRVTAAERRRAERLMGGGSLGRSFSRSYAGSLSGSLASSLAGAAAALPQGGVGVGPGASGTLPHGSALAAAREVAAASLDSPIVRAASPAGGVGGLKRAGAAPAQDPDNLDAKDRRRASLRTYSLLYLKKFSTWRSSQVRVATFFLLRRAAVGAFSIRPGSLSRAFGLGGSSKSSQGHHRDRDHRDHDRERDSPQHQSMHGDLYAIPHRARPRPDSDGRQQQLQQQLLQQHQMVMRESRDRESRCERERDRRLHNNNHHHHHMSSLASPTSSSENGGSSSASPSAMSSPSAGGCGGGSAAAGDPGRPHGGCDSSSSGDTFNDLPLSTASAAPGVPGKAAAAAAKRRHRRVKSIGDIDSVTVTPV